MMNHWFMVSRERMRGILELSMMGLRTLFILNGGADVALFTLLGHLEGWRMNQAKLLFAVLIFASGAVVTLIALLLGFISQSQFAIYEGAAAHRIHDQLVGRPVTDELKAPTIGNVCWYSAVVAATLALGCFICGCLVAYCAVQPRS